MDIPSFFKSFAEPDPRFSPAPIWWWSGERLEIGRMRWQMDQLSAMGIHNVVILNLAPNGPLFGSDADDPPFLSEEWWTIFEQVCDHARKIGMSIWFYDQIGFSGANYQAELVAANSHFLAARLRVISVEGTGPLRVDCPGGATPIAAYVVPLDDPNAVRHVSHDDRGATFTASTASRLNLVHAVRQGYDYFNRAACEKLLDTVHREFARRVPQHIGSTIVGSFQDELPDLPTWSNEFAATFADSFGYRIEGVVHRLFESGDAECRRTRLHYHQHRASLAEEALFKRFFHWHEEHGLQCGFDQQSPAREARAAGCVSKYADYIQTHRWYAIPGCDLHGNGKLHSSIAWMYNRPRVWIEGFHSTGWGGTIADTFDWLMPFLQSGSNFYNPHAVYYSTRMGWWEWAPPSTCWRQPYARHYRGFADMVARLTKILSQGLHQASVGVVFPTATVQAAMTPQRALPDAEAADQTLHKLIGSMRWYQRELGVLDRVGLAFHILDENTIQASNVNGGALVFRDVALSTILLPHVTILDESTMAKLRQFAKAGGRIVAVGSASVETPDGDLVNLKLLPNGVFAETAESAAEFLKDAKRTVQSPVPFLHRTIGDLHLLFVPAVAGMATQVKWTGWFANLDQATADPANYLREAELQLPADVQSVWRFDPIGCRTKQISVPNGHLKLNFDGAPFALLAWSNEPAPVESTISQRLIPLKNEWSCEYVPTLPQEYTDIYDPARPELRMPHTAEFVWRAENLPGNVELPTTARATFGVHGWVDSKPAIYSPQFGMIRDENHLYTLGPKGHVPEEFLDLGKMAPGQIGTIRTGVVSDLDQDAVLAVGSNSLQRVRLNGQDLGAPNDAYLWMVPIRLQRGENSIELTLTAEREGRVRAFWCFLQPHSAAAFCRPERITPPDEAISGSQLVYRGHFNLDAPVVSGQVQVATSGMSAVYLDTVLLGRQGGFDPYTNQLRAVKYDLPRIDAGPHELRVEMIEPGTGAPLMVDLCAMDDRGGAITCMSDAGWTVSRDGEPPRPVRLHSAQNGDPAAWHLYRRPHPLPQAAWIEGAQPNVVMDLPTAPPCAQSITQSFEWTIPAGAAAMKLSLENVSDVRLEVDGCSMSIEPDGMVQLSGSATPARRARLTITSRHLAGAVVSAPVQYSLREGTLMTGSWLDQGLSSYSGAIRMRQRFHFDGESGNAALDLGRVCGTVEAHLNGQPLGCRFLPPYRFDLGDRLRRGDNELELLVTNTLANFLATWSPTRGWSPDQFECGVFGPVQILICE